jgi:hypothetical protein
MKAPPLSALAVAAMGGLAVLVACTSTTTDKAADAGDGAADAAEIHDAAAADAARTLDAGGALLAPFVCAVDGIYGEPRPGVPLLELLRVAAQLDALEERPVLAAPTDAGANRSIHAGIPCSGATDQVACQTAFAQLSSGGEALRPALDETDYLNDARAGYFLAFTKGNVVGKVSNRAELGTVFPAIDTPAKALLYANAMGYRVECQRADGWLREEADGWVVRASRGHERRCTRTDVILFLKRDGASVERDVIENVPDSCT